MPVAPGGTVTVTIAIVTSATDFGWRSQGDALPDGFTYVSEHQSPNAGQVNQCADGKSLDRWSRFSINGIVRGLFKETSIDLYRQRGPILFWTVPIIFSGSVYE